MPDTLNIGQKYQNFSEIKRDNYRNTDMYQSSVIFKSIERFSL